MEVSTPILALLAVLVGGMILVAGFALRRQTLQRTGATFDCSLRETLATHGRGWTLGVARYGDDSIEWFRAFSWSPRPKRRFDRFELRVRTRRKPTGPEALALTPGAIVVQCAYGSKVIELAMADDALTGLLAWIEASPAGARQDAGGLGPAGAPPGVGTG
jgi:hypothetical protein